MNTYTYNSACNNNHGLPTVLPPANRIIAIGDVHGDMKLIIDCLVLSNVIEKTKEPSDKSVIVKIKSKTHHYLWCGKNTVVVQIGDQTDSCRPNNSDTSSCNGDNDISDDIQILHFFTKLNELFLEFTGDRVGT